MTTRTFPSVFHFGFLDNAAEKKDHIGVALDQMKKPSQIQTVVTMQSLLRN